MPRTLDDVAWPLRTARLLIRRAAIGDADAVWHYRRLPEVSHYMTALVDQREAFGEYFSEPDRLGRTLIAERDGVVVGDLMVRLEDAWAQREVVEQAVGTQAEIGWAVDPAHQGRGYATEAARELLRLCFEELGLHRVEALCFAANEPSWRLMERIGMRRESRTVAESLHRSGEWMDGLGYAMLEREWRAALPAEPGQRGTAASGAPDAAK
jgi:RimJ/RimL family protein N-acetyltransferase